METREHKRIALEKLSGNWALAVGVTFMAALLGGLITGNNVDLTLGLDSDDLRVMPEFINSYLQIVAPVALVLSIVQLIIGGMIRLGYCRFMLKLYDGEKAELQDLFSQTHRFADGFCLAFLEALLVFLWSLLFIIPGIVAGYRYAMAPFILYENPGMSASEAISASKEMMDGCKLDLFILDFSFIGWQLLSALSLGIGTLWLNPYIAMAHTSFYRMLSPKKYIIDSVTE
jgi:uncharacterized membrane protein